MARRARLALIVLGAVVLIAARLWLAPRPLALGAPEAIVDLRGRLAAAGAVAGAGLGVAAVAAQARAREAAVDASLTGPVWGALPALLVPAALPVQALVAVAGAALVASVTARGPGGLPNVLARGIAVAGTVVALAALGLFLGPGLTPSTATAFLHAALGGALLQATWPRILLGAGLVLVAALLAMVRWRELLLARTGVTPGGPTVDVVAVLASAGSVLVAGVVAGLGLLATRLVRPTIGEHPRQLVPGALAAGAGLATGLDGLSQAAAWPGELPVGVATTALASLLLAWKVIPHDRG